MDFLIEEEREGNSPVILIEAKANEKITNKKLNFSKISPLFGERSVQCMLMANISQKIALQMKNYTIMNPVYCDIRIHNKK